MSIPMNDSSKQSKDYKVVGTTGLDEVHRRYAKERFLAFMAEKFWSEYKKTSPDSCPSEISK